LNINIYLIAGEQSMTTKEKLEDLKKYMKKTAFNQFDLEHLRNVHFPDNKEVHQLFVSRQNNLDLT